MLIEETAIPQAALPVTQFKAHLRLGTGFADDDVQDPVLESFLRAAIAAIEARTGKILIEREFSWELTNWRSVTAQALPVAPVNTILSFVLRDQMDVEDVIDPALFKLQQDMQRPQIKAVGMSLPAIPVGGVCVLRFLAGYGATWDELAADLAQAVLLLAAHYYEYRNETTLGNGCMPFGVTSLIERYRTVRILGGGQG